MTPQAALNLVDQNIAQLNGTREAHLQLQQAIAVLKQVINNLPAKVEPKPKTT